MLILVCGPLQEYLAPISSCSTTYSYCCSHTTTTTITTTTTTSTANTISITTSSSSSSSSNLSAALRVSSNLELVPRLDPLAFQPPATSLTRNQQQVFPLGHFPVSRESFFLSNWPAPAAGFSSVMGGQSHQILIRPTTLKRSVGPRPALTRP